MQRTGSLVLVGTLLACALSFVGCGDDRSASHSDQAQALLAQGQLDEALIELHSALRLAPDDAEYAERIAELLMIKGEPAQARFFFGETYRLDRQRFKAAIRLASLQFAENPEESSALIEEVAANGPMSAWGWIGRSEQALYQHDSTAAVAFAEEGIEIEPENPDAHWQLASANIALIHEHNQSRERVPDALYENALSGLDRFTQLDRKRSWRALSERARLYSAWPGHIDEARESLRVASDRLGELGLVRHEFDLLDRAISYAKKNDDTTLEEWALERKIERMPEIYPTWDELAKLYDRTGRVGALVYRRLADEFPDSTEARIHYARYIRELDGRRRAIRYLEKTIKRGFDAAPLLAEIAKNQFLLGKTRASQKTIAKLEQQFPNSRESVVMAAWGWLQAERPQVAIGVLDENRWTADDIPAQRVRIDAYTQLGDNEHVVEEIEHLIELLPRPDLLTRRRYAEALFDSGQYAAARDAYRRLQRAAPLSPENYTRYAVSIFETKAHAVGRAMLERAVDRPQPVKLAVVSLYEKEGARNRNLKRLRSGFTRALEETPNNSKLLTAYVQFEIEAKTPRNALEPLARSIANGRRGGHPLAGVLSLQAQIYEAMGDRKAAQTTALEVLDVAPTLPGALEFAQKMYQTKPEAEQAIARLTDGVDNADQPAHRHALLGRLYYRAGNPVMARWSYEQALTGGLELPILKNDLAFLLAAQKRDLKRAKVLALQASEALPNQSGVLDTLGFVMLQLNDLEGAIDHLHRGIELARRNSEPQAELQYHLGLALSGLERLNEAEGAFATALALDEDFPDEDAARKKLATIRGEI
ncbi:MAG: tetratricopeptide repeat protein [Myxococcota bacterium]|nr:tetratricopeptide repeat protein [Myxococcota bacterium]